MVALNGGRRRGRLGADGGVAGGRGDTSRVSCVRRSLHLDVKKFSFLFFLRSSVKLRASLFDCTKQKKKKSSIIRRRHLRLHPRYTAPPSPGLNARFNPHCRLLQKKERKNGFLLSDAAHVRRRLGDVAHPAMRPLAAPSAAAPARAPRGVAFAVADLKIPNHQPRDVEHRDGEPQA
jgi:hypothetical protein